MMAAAATESFIWILDSLCTNLPHSTTQSIDIKGISQDPDAWLCVMSDLGFRPEASGTANMAGQRADYYHYHLRQPTGPANKQHSVVPGNC